MTRSPRELAQQKIQMRKQQQKLFEELLTVVDALDHAAEHWQQAAQQHTVQSVSASVNPEPSASLPWWQRWRQWFSLSSADHNAGDTNTGNLAEVVQSAHEGIEMIRASMLSVLRQSQIEPIPAQGQPFDPTTMHALGQEADATVTPQTVVKEVVRGYRWQERVLREAQVIVAVAPED